MFSIGPIILEVLFVLLKPQELWPFLGAIQPLYTIPGLIVLGFVFDAGRYAIRSSQMSASPFLLPALALFFWAMFATAVSAPETVTPEAILFGTSLILSLSIAHALQNLRLYRILAASLLGLALFFSYVAVDQAMAPMKCFYAFAYDQKTNIATGKACKLAEQCPAVDEDYEGSDEKFWKCEHPGLMNTSSIDGRIRFRGYLEDPNEFSLATAMGLPFALAFWERRKKLYTAIIAGGSFLLVGACIFFSQSRGSQIALLAVFGTKFIHRYGWKKGGLVMGIAAVPLMILGSMTGRKAEDAEGSAQERTELLAAGIQMVQSTPILGVGKGQFAAREYMTAHNSYVLVAAELGVVGFVMWSIVFYTAMKIPICALRDLEGRAGEGAAECRIWSSALVASLVSGMIGAFFLSWSYHNYLWIYVGVAGALFGVVRKELPGFSVGMSSKELGALVAVDVALLAGIGGYAKYKLAGH